MPLSSLDLIGVATFLLAWGLYHVFVEQMSTDRPALNNLMNAYRVRWMLEMAARENRIIDSSLLGTLQSGTAFFASTSLFALGGALALLRGDDAMRILSDLPLGAPENRALWDMKVIGLALIFGYAFFKFAWSYRLFNYVTILIGATPAAVSELAEERHLTALRAGEMCIVAGRHFNRGQRAFFFALAYLGWFINPIVLMAATILILVMILMRQFASDARAAVTLELPAGRHVGRGSGSRKGGGDLAGQPVEEKPRPFARDDVEAAER